MEHSKQSQQRQGWLIVIVGIAAAIAMGVWDINPIDVLMQFR